MLMFYDQNINKGSREVTQAVKETGLRWNSNLRVRENVIFFISLLW